MKTGITWHYRGNGSDAATLEKLKADGYDTLDLQNLVGTEEGIMTLGTHEFEKTLKEIGRTAAESGMELWQTHGPWVWPVIYDGSPEGAVRRLRQMEKAAYGTALAGAKYMAIHPMMPYGVNGEEPEKTKEMNLDFWYLVGEKAKEYGTVICLENMPWKDFTYGSPYPVLDLVKEIGLPNVKMTLDTGHSADCGVSPADAVRAIGKEYLAILHVHDNDGVRDNHWLPFEGTIDWKAFMTALKDVGFDGSLSIEGSFLPKANRYSDSEESGEVCRRLLALA